MDFDSRHDRRVFQPFDEKNFSQKSSDDIEKIKPIYTAYFVTDLPGLTSRFQPKHTRTFAHHATIAFKPQNISGITVGKQVTLRVIGRVFDEKGDALLLEGGQTQQKNLHITLSCAEGVSPIYSNELIDRAIQEGKVEKIDPPLEIQTVEGYFDGKDVTKLE